MPWLALPYSERKVKNQLSSMFEVDGIPTLVVLDENGKTITTNGRAAVSHDPEGKEFPWKPKPVELLNDMTVAGVNDSPAALLVLDQAQGADTAARAEAVLGATARGVKAEEEAEDGEQIMVFMYNDKGDDLMQRVLGFMGVKEVSGDTLIMLDIPSQKYAMCSAKGKDLGAEAAAKFVKDFRSGALEMQSLAGDE